MNDKAKVAITSGGKSIYISFGGNIVLESISGASSVSVDVGEVKSAGVDGSTIMETRTEPRDITVTGELLDDIPAMRELLLQIVVPHRIVRITVWDNSPEEWWIEGQPTHTPIIDDGVGVQGFQFKLRCPYPYWQSGTGTSNQIAGLTSTFKFSYTFRDTWYISRRGTGQYKTVENTGNVPVPFTVTFTAESDVQNPEISLVDTNRYVRFLYTLLAGERLVLNTIPGQKDAVLYKADGTKTNAFKFLEVGSDLGMTLAPGANMVRYEATSNRDALGVFLTAPKGAKHGI